jgi:hypothetical protein
VVADHRESVAEVTAVSFVSAVPGVEVQLFEASPDCLVLEKLQERGAVTGAAVGWQCDEVIKVKNSPPRHCGQLSEAGCCGDHPVGLDEGDFISGGRLFSPALHKGLLIEVRAEFAEGGVAAPNEFGTRCVFNDVLVFAHLATLAKPVETPRYRAAPFSPPARRDRHYRERRCPHTEP